MYTKVHKNKKTFSFTNSDYEHDLIELTAE